MKKCFVLFAAVLAFSLVASATDWPTGGVFLGYNFAKFNPDSPYLPALNMNGGSGQFSYNFWKGLGVAVDLGAVTKGNINGFNVDATVVDFVAGPRYTFRTHTRFMPYVQCLFGGAYSTASLQAIDAVVPPGVILPPGRPFTARIVTSRTGFAMLTGGGLDIKLTKMIYFRPFEASYYLTRMPSFLTGNDRNTSNFRYAGGFNFTFGAK
jgi:hypothetical protein